MAMFLEGRAPARLNRRRSRDRHLCLSLDFGHLCRPEAHTTNLGCESPACKLLAMGWSQWGQLQHGSFQLVS